MVNLVFECIVNYNVGPGMSAERSWVHSLFWPKRIGTGDVRFCKRYYPQEEEVPSVEQVKQLIDAGFAPSGAFRGCVVNTDSPSSMQNHTRSKHADHLPVHVQGGRSQGGLGQKTAKLDVELLASWALHIVLGALREVDVIDDPHDQPSSASAVSPKCTCGARMSQSICIGSMQIGWLRLPAVASERLSRHGQGKTTEITF